MPTFWKQAMRTLTCPADKARTLPTLPAAKVRAQVKDTAQLVAKVRAQVKDTAQLVAKVKTPIKGKGKMPIKGKAKMPLEIRAMPKGAPLAETTSSG